MKKIVLVFVVVISSFVSLTAQTAPDALELTQMLHEFLAGAGRNDAAVHDRFWADDLIYTRSAGVRTNKEEIMKGLRAAPARKEGDPVNVYSAEDIKIQQYGNAAVVAFKLIGTTTRADGTKTNTNNLNTGTFVKRSGKWQVVAWQSTVVPEPKPTAAQPATQTAPATAPATDPAKSEKPTTTADGRTYVKGPRGGCYYVGSGGKKVYVKDTYCK